MSEQESIIKKTPTRKQKLLAEKERLEKYLMELDAVSESQIYHIKAKIKQIDKEISEIDTKKFGNATDKLNQEMAQKNMMAAMTQGQGRN